MQWTTEDPDGALDSGTRWTIKYGTPHTVRVIHGLYLSDVREDDLIIWTIEKHGVPEDRPYSGRRGSFNRWELAKPPLFELGHTYTDVPLAGQIRNDRTYRVIHVFETGETAGQVVTVDNRDKIVGFDPSERPLYQDITGKDAVR